eukprot:TRINITY_DN11066_c0_g1_i1.p1 TRINITY_DN11066_c0_g1~~TRINITY_DN11066_c0_g1_i1.p1  ORF type:complete len:270 (+),score=35.05 TRINITY_DN11066_c0_g1_i1:71-880(+)
MQISGQKKKKAKQKAKPTTTGGISTMMGTSDVKMTFKESAKEEAIQPGVVVLRGAIPIREQQHILNDCFKLGELKGDQAGFYQQPTEEGGRLRLNQGNRGRIIHAMSAYGDYLNENCQKWLKMAQAVDKTLPDMIPSTVLVNYYNVKGSFKWHRDSEHPEFLAKGIGKPIVSATIGESCDFAIKDEYDTPETVITLHSGDIIVFGGPSRMIVHSVLKIHPNTRPPLLKFPYQPGRLNLTFREVNGTIDTSMFPAYRVSYDIEDEEGNSD